MNELYAVRAVKSDADILFEWANDKETRKNAFHTGPIAYETHLKWFEEKLKDENSVIFICKKNNENVGMLRFDRDGSTAVISYSIDKLQRGKGYGTSLINLAQTVALNEPCLKGVVRLVGYVKTDNIPSRKCFEKNGYTCEKCDTYLAYSKVLC